MILEIDTGAGFVPVACLTDVSQSESAGILSTTTRQNGGWETQRPVIQEMAISIDGLIPRGIAFSYRDLAELKRDGTKFAWKIENDYGMGFIADLNLTGVEGEDVNFTATIVNTGKPVDTIPTGYSVAFFEPPYSGSFFTWDLIDGEVGAIYNVTVTSSGGGTPYTRTGTVTSENMRFFGQSLAGLNPGTLTIELTLTNALGTGPIVTDTALYSPITPVGISITGPTPGTIVEGANAVWEVTYTDADTITLAAGDISLSGGFTGTIAVTNGPDPATQRTITISNITGTVPGATAPSIASGTATNGTGGSAPGITGGSLNVNPPAPAGYAVQFDNDPINSQTPSITISGGNGEGVTFSYAIIVQFPPGGGPVVGSNIPMSATPFQITPAPNVAALPNGTLQINVTIVGPGGTQNISDTAVKNI